MPHPNEKTATNSCMSRPGLIDVLSTRVTALMGSSRHRRGSPPAPPTPHAAPVRPLALDDSAAAARTRHASVHPRIERALIGQRVIALDAPDRRLDRQRQSRIGHLGPPAERWKLGLAALVLETPCDHRHRVHRAHPRPERQYSFTRIAACTVPVTPPTTPTPDSPPPPAPHPSPPPPPPPPHPGGGDPDPVPPPPPPARGAARPSNAPRREHA